MAFEGGFAGGSQLGGGFMPSQAAPAATMGGAGSAAPESSMRALTIRQIAQGLNTSDSADRCFVDGREIANVCIIGRIMSVKNLNTTIETVLFDGTGNCTVKTWTDNATEEASREADELTEGVYVKAYGRVTAMEGLTHLNCFKMRKVEDFNEITHHFLNAVYQHLHIGKGGAATGGGGAAPMQPANTGGMPNAAAGGGNPMGPGPQATGNASYSACANDVLALLNSEHAVASDVGLGISEMVTHFGDRYSETEIKGACHFLSNAEAAIYETIDDCHFKSTA